MTGKLERVRKKAAAIFGGDSLLAAGARFVKWYDKGVIQENLVLVECNEGQDISEDACRILKELEENGRYKLIAAVGAGKEMLIRGLLAIREAPDIETVTIHSDQYCRALATAHYLINNLAFPEYFIKNKDQVYIHTGSGISPEYAGKRMEEDLISFANEQRNLRMADYLLCRDELWRERIEEGYMLKNLFKGKYIAGNRCNDCEEQNIPVQELTDIVFFHKSNKSVVQKEAENKQNILIFGGMLARNGITTALRGLLNHIDLEKRNYILLLNAKDVQNNIGFLKELDKRLDYVFISGEPAMTRREVIAKGMYFGLWASDMFLLPQMKKIYKREVQRVFGQARFDAAIHFTGYEKSIAFLIAEMEAKRVIFVHSNMNAENSTRGNFSVPAIKYAYKNFDYIAGVRDGMKEEIQAFMGTDMKDKIRIVHNVNDTEKIIDKAKKEIQFDPGTESTHTEEEISAVLNNEESLKFITIGRFSVEKAHDRLIDAFEKFSEKNKNSYLILIGGQGPLYQETLDKVKESAAGSRIIVIKDMSNPYPILAKCDAFFMSSLYEGLPMTIMEALILGIPVISVDIDGPRQFLQQGYGELVETSVEGLLTGMEKFAEGKICLRPFDSDGFNRKALQEFEALLS